MKHPIYQQLSSLILFFWLIVLFSCGSKHGIKTEADKNWPEYLGGKSRNHYSPLKQINKENINQLKVAWEYHTGDEVSDNRTQIQCNPLVIDGIMFGTSPKLKVFAIDAATGKEIWKFDPSSNINYALNVNRGVAYWEDGDDQRILFTAGPTLFALNAKTGKLVQTFGAFGKVSLKEGLGEKARDLYVVSTTPGIIYKDLLIIGTRVSEGADAAPGFIRAYNVCTGKVAWIFHTIPQPGEFGYDTWPKDGYQKVGSVNSWAGMSLDEKRGIVYIPTGSAAYDFWGGNRIGQDLFANCVLALNAATGQRIWHFQTVHHDLWDRDLPAPPNLVTITHNGKRIDAVAQITKSAMVFLLDRDTGVPIFPVEERAVPQSDLNGEQTWPTQPFPVKPPPFARQHFTTDEITNISKESHDYVAGILSNVRTGQQFIPPSKEGTIIFPGFDGGGEWGGAGFDPQTGILYISGSVMPWILTMVETVPKGQKAANLGEMTYRINCAVCHGQQRQGDPSGTFPPLVNIAKKYKKDSILQIVNTGRGFMPSFAHLDDEQKEAVINYLLNKTQPTDPHMMGIQNTSIEIPYIHTGYNRFFDQYGYPAVKPPWGTLTAIDLNEGSITWQVPLGEFPELAKKGIPKTGTENYGGPVVTAGGLLLIGASKDGYFRAFDKKTGEELWKYQLPAGGYATPSVYEVGGKEFVVIACGGGKMGTKSGDSYVAFTLGRDR